MTIDPIPVIATTSSNMFADDDQRLLKVAKDLEASFLAEMLKQSGVGTPRESFGGGVGESQFSSFLVEAHAAALVENGGLGLAEQIFETLKERTADNG